MMRLKAIDLFCGCGGLTLGLKQAGFTVIGAVDIDPLSASTYKANHKGVHVWRRNIRSLSAPAVMRRFKLKKGELDLLAGCPPCQGFSSVRTLNGKRVIKDPRNDLVFEFLRFVKRLLPKAVMMENVPGLKTDARCTKLIGKLESLGYTVNCDVLNAADYGVPQRRRRMILLASRFGKVEFAEPVKERRSVRDAIAGLPKAGNSGDPLHDMPERRTEGIVKLIKRIPLNGGSRTDLGNKYQLECHKKCNGFKDIYGRMAWDKVAPTITTGCFNPSKGRFLHPTEHRAISMREAALLQGFPRRYIFSRPNSKSSVALLIGNALPPPFVRIHAQNVRETIRHGIRPC